MDSYYYTKTNHKTLYLQRRLEKHFTQRALHLNSPELKQVQTLLRMGLLIFALKSCGKQEELLKYIHKSPQVKRMWHKKAVDKRKASKDVNTKNNYIKGKRSSDTGLHSRYTSRLALYFGRKQSIKQNFTVSSKALLNQRIERDGLYWCKRLGVRLASLLRNTDYAFNAVMHVLNIFFYVAKISKVSDVDFLLKSLWGQIPFKSLATMLRFSMVSF